MRTLYLFGDSFLAPYSDKELDTFNWKREYIKAEQENGNEKIQDINYWLKANTGNDIRVVNTARSGSSNDYIMEQFFRFSKYFKFGDYVIILFTKYNRTRVVNRFYDPKKGNLRKLDKYLDLTFPLLTELYEPIRRQTFFTPDEIEKMALETTSLQHDVKMKRYLEGIKQLSYLSKINLLTISIESELRPHTTLENIFHEVPRINEKFSYLDDRHPTWEGNRVLVERFLNYFNILKAL